MKKFVTLTLAALALTAAANAQDFDLEDYDEITESILSPDYQSVSSGWLGTGFGWAFGCAEIYQGSESDSYQILENMPAGTYTLKCNGFYRDGANHTSASDECFDRVYMYINDAKTYLKNLYSDDSYTFADDLNSYTYPDNMEQASNAFASGKYLNQVTFTLDKAGDLRIGVCHPDERVARDWYIVDNFKLTLVADGQTTDMTDRIYAADFTENPTLVYVPGWDGEAPVANRDANTYEWYNKGFTFTQTISNLYSGKYLVNVTGFARGKQNVNLVANEVQEPIAELTEEDQATVNNMTNAGEAFDFGLFTENYVECVINEDGGSLTFGLVKEDNDARDWVIIRDFKLYTMGGGVMGVSSAKAESDIVNVYTATGLLVKKNVNVADAKNNLPAGLYIIGGHKVIVK